MAATSSTNVQDDRNPHGASPAVVPLRVVYPDTVSPSLQTSVGAQPAYEMKFLLPEPQAAELEGALRSQLSLDPYSNNELGAGYRLSTLYCDTPCWDVFHRVGRYKLFKFRLRRYGDSDIVFLERKSKRGWQVRKRRSTIALTELGLFSQPSSRLHTTAGGDPNATHWYHSQLYRNQFQPVCQIEYQRMAYFGSSDEGPLRLTFDRQVQGALTNAWSLDAIAQPMSLLPGLVVCEFKYRGSLPAVFKAVIQAMQLTPRGVSKYRHCIQATGGVLKNA